MSTTDTTRFARLRRAWLRAGLMTAAGAGAVVLVTTVLLHEDEPAKRALPRNRSAPAADSAAVATPTTTSPAPLVKVELAPRKKPTTVKELFAQDAILTSAELAAWTADATIEPQVRYSALRRLEEADPSAAVSSALELLDEPTPLLRLNAIALLTRANDDRAREALGKLDQRSLLMAHAIARRRGS